MRRPVLPALHPFVGREGVSRVLVDRHAVRAGRRIGRFARMNAARAESVSLAHGLLLDRQGTVVSDR